MKNGRNLLSLRHEDLNEAIVRLLRNRLRAGSRGSIKRSILQRELARSEGLDAVLGNARSSVESNINKAISALRHEQTPRIEKDREDHIVRLAKKKIS
jgi:hypothetical protein